MGSEMGEFRVDLWIDGWNVLCMNVMDGCVNGCMYVWMNGWKDGWVNGFMYVCMD